MQIPWPSWMLPFHPFVVARRVGAWNRRRRLGLPPLSTPPVTTIPVVDPGAFERSGFQPLPVDPLPYERQAMDYLIEDELLDLADPGLPLDDRGVMLWRDRDGSLQHHPVAIAQYALAALGGFARTGEHHYLERAIVNAEALVAISEPADGARWFPYRFPYTYYDVTMPVPWWSSMGQGQSLSVFCRLAALRPDEPRWRELADETFRSFTEWRRLGAPWVTTMDAGGLLWFEEYAGDVEPLLVVNGHVFAIYGVYDYAMLTGDALAVSYFDGATTTVLRSFDRFRAPGAVSYYCTREGYCRRPEWQNAGYHPIHIQQLEMLGRMTGDLAFERCAELLREDHPAR